MPRTETILQAFVASPGDVAEERALLEEVIREFNATWRSSLGVSIELVRWETHAVPGVGTDAQDVINKSVGDKYDIFIGIMWGRFGTPTTNHASGTEEEARRAYQKWKDDPNSVRIMFYFKDEGISPNLADLDQLRKIQEFRACLGEEGTLFWHYKDTDHFSQLLRIHLSRVVQNWGATSAPNSSSPDVVECESDDDSGGDAIGLLDLLEALEDSILELGDVATRMGEATNEIGATMTVRTEELNALKVGEQIKDFRAAKRVFNRAAQDLEHFSSRLKVDIGKFSECNLAIADSTSKLATLVGEFSAKNEDELAQLMAILDNLLTPLATLPENIKGFRDGLNRHPRVSVEYNRAKKAVVRMLDKFLDAIDKSLSVGRESRALIRQIYDRRRTPTKA